MEDLAAPLPAMMIGKLLGFPDDLWPKLSTGPSAPSPPGGGPGY